MIFLPEYLFASNGKIVKGFAVETDDVGLILDVFEAKNAKKDNFIKLYGLLLPGLVNSHCHLELSWVKKGREKNLGIENFYNSMRGIHNKKPSNEIVLSAINNCVSKMKEHGVVAIADVSNTQLSVDTKATVDVFFHTFLEYVGASVADADKIIKEMEITQNVFSINNQSYSIAIHSLFTLSEKLMNYVIKKASEEKKPISIHFLESEEEKMYFENKRQIVGIKQDWNMNYNSPTEAAIGILPNKNKILFVHNTFANEYDLNNIIKNFNNAWFCLCPLSNLYISGKLPDAQMIFTKSPNVLLGTDSLSSNDSLNMFKEIDTLLDAFPKIKIENLLQAATINGAKFLDIDKKLGSIDKNKMPGLVLLENYIPNFSRLSALNCKRIF